MSARRVRITRALSWASLALFLALQCIASILQQPPVLVWVMRVLPLMVFLPGMISDKLRSYIWLCFVCLLYFITLVERLFVQPDNAVAWLAMVSLVSLFITSMLYVRWRARELREVSHDD